MYKGRSGIAAAMVAGRNVVVGGEEAAGTIRPVEEYGPGRRARSSLPGMPSPRHGLGRAALGQHVFALEGGVRPGFSFSPARACLGVSLAVVPRPHSEIELQANQGGARPARELPLRLAWLYQ
jgi:hypothetical protein